MLPRVRLVRPIGIIALLGMMAANMSASAHNILLGVGTHVVGHAAAEQQSQLNLARKLGFNAVRDDFLWQYVETSKGVYHIPAAWDQYVNAARQRGIEPLAILDYGNKFYDGGNKPRSPQAIEGYIRYATFVVKHFAGRIKYFEIWNEWDNSTGGFPPGSARDYARLFDAVYPVLKKVDPTGVFLACASAPGNNAKKWYEQLAKLGVAESADGVSVHPYVYPQKPNMGSSLGSDEAERSVQEVMNIETTMRRLSGGKEIPLYVTEIGWPTNIGRFGLAESGVASLAQRSLLMLAALPYVQGAWWYDLQDGCSNRTYYECHFGLARQDLALKPAARAIQAIAPLVKHNSLSFSSQSNLQSGLVVLKRNAEPVPSIIAWHIGSRSQSGGAADSARYTVTCVPSLKIGEAVGNRAVSDLSVTAVPTIFSYRHGQCMREVGVRAGIARSQ